METTQQQMGEKKGKKIAIKDAEKGGTPTPVPKNKLLDMFFPVLTLYRGTESLGRYKSIRTLAVLYFSHILSAWGDRMWQFLVFLLLALLYPGSLLLPAGFGLVWGLMAAVFGTMIGDWVDSNRRMKVIGLSLFAQNGLLLLSAGVLGTMFWMNLGICEGTPLYFFAGLAGLVIVLGSSANLATVAHAIAIEKDWIVVIADRNENTLAVLNANMRRIDLSCKWLAPVVSGVLLQYTGPLQTTIVIAGWNVVGFFFELGLKYMVYRWIKPLAKKRLRRPSYVAAQVSSEKVPKQKSSVKKGEKKIEGEEKVTEALENGVAGLGENHISFSGETEADIEYQLQMMARKRLRRKSSVSVILANHIKSPFVSIWKGWRTYARQDIALAGLALGTIYLTVLGFCGVTSTYFLIQGLREDYIGLAQGVGAVWGIMGTMAYPYIRKKIGTVRSGLLGISLQYVFLLFCGAAVLVPGQRATNTAESYYAADCPAEESPLNFTCDPSNDSAVAFASSLPFPTPSISFHTVSTSFPGSDIANLLPTPTDTPSPSPSSPSFPLPDAGSGSGSDNNNRYAEPTVSPSCTPSPDPVSEDSGSADGGGSDTKELISIGSVGAHLLFMMIGVLGARFGLWIFDLSVQQLVQEKVDPENRGVVGGVLNAMNSIMDMLHYVLVIGAPRPEDFGYLVYVSLVAVGIGWMLYAAYVHKAGGCFFCLSKPGPTDDGDTSIEKAERASKSLSLSTEDDDDDTKWLRWVELGGRYGPYRCTRL